MKCVKYLYRSITLVALVALWHSPAIAGTDASSTSFDPDTVSTKPALIAKLPAHIAQAGVLKIGSDTSYAPWEYLAGDDGQTPEGIDVDLAKAIAKSLNLKLQFQSANFDNILPSIGPKYDLGISAFTITNKRLGAVNFVSYAYAGSLWAVKAGNPTNFDPTNLCGHVIAIQTGTVHEKAVEQADKACASAGKAAVQIIPFAKQTDALTRVAVGGADATYSGSATIGYAVRQSNGQLQIAGKLQDFVLNGIAIAKADQIWTDLVAETVNSLIADGSYAKIMQKWGIDSAAIQTAEINPKASE